MTHRMAGIRVAGAALLFSFLFMSPSAPASASESCSDVALVLAIDGSASVTPGEFLLEKRGIAASFRNPDVLNAIRKAGKVTVSAVFWGSEGMPKVVTNWIAADGPAGADRFARTIENMPRQVTGDTGLGSGLAAALARLTAPDLCAVRKIINLSGDGMETLPVRGKRRSPGPSQVRDLAQELQVEINALAISDEQADLADYYRRNVITGPDAFVMEVRDYAGFTAALSRKLIREISPRAVASLPVPAVASVRPD